MIRINSLNTKSLSLFNYYLKHGTVPNAGYPMLNSTAKKSTCLSHSVHSIAPIAISFTPEGAGQAVKLANPLSSELDILRMSMIPALLENIAWNKNKLK